MRSASPASANELRHRHLCGHQDVRSGAGLGQGRPASQRVPPRPASTDRPRHLPHRDVQCPDDPGTHGEDQAGRGGPFFNHFLSALPPLVAAVPLLPRALELAKQFRQTVYDCLYVALAEREGYELVSADDKLVKAVQPTLPFVIPLSSLP